MIPCPIFWMGWFFVSYYFVGYRDGAVVRVDVSIPPDWKRSTFSCPVFLYIYSYVSNSSILTILLILWCPYPLPFKLSWVSSVLPIFLPLCHVSSATDSTTPLLLPYPCYCLCHIVFLTITSSPKCVSDTSLIC